MRAAVFQGAGRVSAGEWPRPSIGPGELLLRLRGCGLCGSDIAKIVGAATPAPAVFGHEVVGESRRWADTDGFREGDRWWRPITCRGVCHYCVRGSESMCRAFKESNLDPGGFAEFVRVPAPNVRHATFHVPDHLTDEEATFVEPLACCLRAVERAGVRVGDIAVVIGLGSIGCLFVQSPQAGAEGVGSDPVSRRHLARSGGTGRVLPVGSEPPCEALAGAPITCRDRGGAAVLPHAGPRARGGHHPLLPGARESAAAPRHALSSR